MLNPTLAKSLRFVGRAAGTLVIAILIVALLLMFGFLRVRPAY